MNTRGRPLRILVPLGLAILVGSAAGASWVLYSQAGDAILKDSAAASPVVTENLDIVACPLGYVDVKHGLRLLNPAQAGRVEQVLVEDFQTVEAGAVLLSIEKKQAQYQVQKAEAELKAAEVLRDQAAKGIDQFPSKEAQLRAAIAVLEGKVSEAESGLRRRENLRGLAGGSEEEVAGAKAQVRQAKAAVEGEQERLKELQAHDPRLALRAAEVSVEAKKTQLEEAQEGLKECDLRAPVAGTVLRIRVGKGELSGPQAREAAIVFSPDEPLVIRAELDQETAGQVKPGQLAEVEDYSKNGVLWTGKVEAIAPAYLPRRTILPEPIQVNPNDNRLLECLIALDAGQTPPRINQKVRVKIRAQKGR